MKMLIAVAAFLLLANCGGFVFPGPSDPDVIASGGRQYPYRWSGHPGPTPGYGRISTTCTTIGQNVVCR